MIERSVDLSVVLVSWNTANLTLRALRSLPDASSPLSLERICVDNGSSDDTVERIRRRHPDVHVLENGANEGFARAANRSLPHLAGRYTCFLNSDARPRPGALAHVVQWMDEHPAVIVAAPSLVDADDKRQAVGRPDPSLLTMLYESTDLALGGVGRRCTHAWRSGLSVDVPTSVPNVVGACLMIRTEWFRALGGFDGAYFFYWEDTDLCRAVRRRGGSVWVVPDGPPVEHLGGASTPSGSTDHRLAFFAGQLRYLRGEFSPAAGDALAALVVVGLWLRAWRRGLGLGLRSMRRRMLGRTEAAERAGQGARAWLGMIERHGLTLLKLLRRPRLHLGARP